MIRNLEPYDDVTLPVRLTGNNIITRGNVYLFNIRLVTLPHFKYVNGGLYCDSNQLTSLEGCPAYIGGYFDCRDNKLTSLEYCATYIGGGLYCSHNQLTSLKGCPAYIGGDLHCYNNKLTSLKYCPASIGSSLYCSDNEVKLSRPEGVEMGGMFIN